ncbi:hypothetical protein M3175_05425 [Robertmurraya korlensis]|uniref:hypothetical protein n=1 Tax=Robertmurraya korlensis TaxID=519977 RepID=UPI0020401E33|nr:hypothetical protein [Robertmurraya korlensis]MCM3600164.1 hypothetical protein [Robertmurraya korlensis]
MSLKAIEMQIALPRMQDASKLQEQIQQRGQQQNDVAANSVAKEVEKNRNSVNKHEQKEQVRLKDQQRNKNGNQEGKKNKKNKERQPVKEVHPYKGNFFDFSG